MTVFMEHLNIYISVFLSFFFHSGTVQQTLSVRYRGLKYLDHSSCDMSTQTAGAVVWRCAAPSVNMTPSDNIWVTSVRCPRSTSSADSVIVQQKKSSKPFFFKGSTCNCLSVLISQQKYTSKTEKSYEAGLISADKKRVNIQQQKLFDYSKTDASFKLVWVCDTSKDDSQKTSHEGRRRSEGRQTLWIQVDVGGDEDGSTGCSASVVETSVLSGATRFIKNS